MAKADVLALANTLSMNLADVAQTPAYYRNVVIEYGSHNLLTAATLVPATHVTSQYTLPDDSIDVLGMIYDDRLLSLESIMSLDWIDPNWRSTLGPPVAYIREQESAPNFRIYPRPEQPSKPFSFATGSPLGADFPAYAILVLHTETRDNVLPYMELPLALALLVPEFERESAHRDRAFANSCKLLSDLLTRMIV